MSNNPMYTRWVSMIQRTSNPNDPGYRFYGARGVSVCLEWRNSFLEFYNWSLKNGYSKELQLDRVDPNGNYCPENCRYITQLENSRRQRRNFNWGVYRTNSGKFWARVQIGKKIYNLGTHNSQEKAREMRDKFTRGEIGVVKVREDKGVYEQPHGFVVHVVKNNKCHHVGTYKNKEDAIIARDEFAKKLTAITK